MESLLVAGKWRCQNYLCKIELNKQTEISLEDDDNQNNQNYSETVSSQLHATLIVRLMIKLNLWILYKDKYLILYIIGLSYMSKLSWGLLQGNQHYCIYFSQGFEADTVVNHI